MLHTSSGASPQVGGSSGDVGLIDVLCWCCFLLGAHCACSMLHTSGMASPQVRWDQRGVGCMNAGLFINA